jgi:hypothetical protein
MASIIAPGILLAFILFGALERLVPSAGRLLGALSGFAFTLLALWGIYLGGAWGLHKFGMYSNPLVANLNTTSWLSAFAEQASIVIGISALIMALLLPLYLSLQQPKRRLA